MNLMSIVNIYENRKDRTAAKETKNNSSKSHNGFSEYEALEFNKSKQDQISFELKMELFRTYAR